MPGNSAMKVSLASTPTATTNPIATERRIVRPRRYARSNIRKVRADARNSRLSPCTPAAMKLKVGWNATARAPTVHVHGVAGNSSRRNRNTVSTVHAAISAERRRISARRVRMSCEGESQ